MCGSGDDTDAALCVGITKSCIIVSVCSLMYVTRYILSAPMTVILLVFLFSSCIWHRVGV